MKAPTYARELGYRAFVADDRSHNPFRCDRPEYDEFEAGWQAARRSQAIAGACDRIVAALKVG